MTHNKTICEGTAVKNARFYAILTSVTIIKQDFAHFSTSSRVIIQALNTLPEFLCPPGNSSILYCMVFIQSLNLVGNDFCITSKVTSIYDVLPNFCRISIIFLMHILPQCPTSTCVQTESVRRKPGRTCTNLVSVCRY